MCTIAARPIKINRRRSSGVPLMLLALLTLLGIGGMKNPPAAHAQGVGDTTAGSSAATTYSTRRRLFKVGILLLDSTIDRTSTATIARGPENPDPYIFYIAEARADVKPQNWEFVNPLSPATVTNEQKARWDARVGGDSGYTIGQKVEKNMAAYWEVNLTDTPLTDLLQFDLLFITNHRTVALTPADREKLRKLVDAGGIVWLEDCGNMRIGTKDGMGKYRNDRFFLDELQFTGGVTSSFPSGDPPGPVINQPTHPILNTPYQLSFQEISNLGDKNYADYGMTRIDPTTGVESKGVPNPEVLVNIVGNRGVGTGGGPYQPYIAAGYYGSGGVIATSGDSGCDINDYAGGENVGSGGNSGPRCGPNINTAHAEDLKFLYNSVAWGGANNAYRRNNRRTASTFEAVGAPLLTTFDLTGALYDPTNDKVDSKSAPLIVNGLLFTSGVSNGQMVLRAYDPRPFNDYDGDGNFDEGRPDVSLGYGYDEVWSMPLGKFTSGTANPSAPVFGEVDFGGGVHRQVVYVTLPDGTVVGYDAFPTDNFGRLTATSNLRVSATPPDGVSGNYDVTATHGVAPAPVFLENKIYSVEPNGKVQCLSAADGTLLWKSFASAPTTIVPYATPTLGFSRLAADITQSRNPNAGTPSASTSLAANSLGSTNDLMLYVPVEIAPASGGGNPITQVMAYWLGTRNEVQSGFPQDTYGRTGLMNTRLSGGIGSSGAGQFDLAPGSPFLFPKVRVYEPTRDDASGTKTGIPYQIIETAQQHYEQGKESDNYAGAFGATGPDGITGRVQITAVGTAVPPGPANYPNNEPALLIAVDYDVLYVQKDGTTPKNYTSNTTMIGARYNPNLWIPNYDAGSATFDTMGFSPDDTLIYGARQNATTGSDNRLPMVSLFGLHEEEGNTRLRWRFTLPHILNDGVTQQGGGKVNDVYVNDGSPIQNTINFDRNWPEIDQADKSGSVASAVGAVTITRTVGSPIITNDGLTYILAEGVAAQSFAPRGTPVTVLMALKSEPDVTLTLPVAFQASRGVTVSQLDALTNDPSTAPRVIQASANTGASNVLRLDAPRGKIDIVNFNTGNGQFSASQSFVVSCTPVGEASPRRFIVTPSADNLTGQTVGTTGQPNPQELVSGGFTPLRWYYVLLGQPESAPTLAGDYIFFTLQNRAGGTADGKCFLMGLEVDPTASDPGVRVGFSSQVPNVTARETDPAFPANPPIVKTVNHIKMGQVLAGGQQYLDFTAAPVASGGILALNSSAGNATPAPTETLARFGTYSFGDQTTLIADARRILEVGADASAQWTLDATQLRQTVGGDLPIFGADGKITNPPALGRVSLDTVTLSHPSKARKIGNGDYLIADTGNNRVVRVDRGGLVSWSLDKIADPYQILSGGEPLTLSSPTDVQYYVTPTVDNAAAPTKQVGYEIHYLVADAGNFRIVEVADYYDSRGVNIDAPGKAGTKGQHVVVYTTRTQSQQGRQLHFEGINRYLGFGPDPNSPQYYGYPFIVATVSNTRVSGGTSSASSDFSGGSLVSIRYAPYNTALQVRDNTDAQKAVTPWLPGATNAAIAANEPTGNGTVLAAADDLRLVDATGKSVVRRLARPTYFQQLTLPGADATKPTGGSNPARTVYLVADADGVYAVYAYTTAGGTSVRQVLWMFRQQEYDKINGYDYSAGAVDPNGRIAVTAAAKNELPKFAPTAIRLLPNGHFLITNSWTGKSALFQNGRFTGEVFEIDPKMSLITQMNAVDAASGTPTLYYGLTGYSGSVFSQFAAPRLLKGDLTKMPLPTLNDQLMGNPGNTNLLEQPLFADRQ